MGLGMKIVFQHQCELPVATYGGTERILFWLMKEFVRQGHQVCFLGDPRSRLAEYGIELIPVESGSQDWRPLIPKDVDVVHAFSTPPFELEVPHIVTIEGNGKPGEEFHHNTVFVSGKHAELHGSHSFVHNGIDLEEYPFRPRAKPAEWENFLFLAKAKWPVKNLRHCVRACRAGRRHLHIAGGRSWWPSRYIHNYGMVDQVKKNELLAKTDALLFPVRWHEPFGIAVIEAFAAGLPVIASPYGSLPELVNDRVGVICRNYDELALAVRERPRDFDAEEIRHYVETKFGIPVIANQYLSLYEKVIGGEKLNAVRPRATFHEDAQLLLPY
jgi:glycosyltransferase involved in cell wall biosynthesis